MEKSTLSVLAFCLGASSLTHAQDIVDLQTLKVLEEKRMTVDEYHQLAERFPGVLRSSISGSNYDTFNSNVSGGNYDTFNSNLSSGNYDTFNSNITAANYDTFNSNLTAGNYTAVDPDLLEELARMPAPQANE